MTFAPMRACAVAALTLLALSASLIGTADAALPEAVVCFFGYYPNPNGYAYLSYLQPRYKNVQFKPAIIGVQNRSVSYEAKADHLRADLVTHKCDVVVDNGGNSDNYTLYRKVRGEPGAPLWVESTWGKRYFNTIDEADKYPALRMWPLAEDQSVTAINTALALGWKDIVIVSTNSTTDNATLKTMSAQAEREGLRVHKTFIRGEEGMETTEDLVEKIAAESPTRAVLSATSQTSVIQALVDSPKGLVPIVPLDKKTDYLIRASLGVLAPQELVLTPPENWQDHWKNNTFTNHTRLWELWQVTQPRSGDQYYFRNTTNVYMNDVEAMIAALAVVDEYFKGGNATNPMPRPTAQQLLDTSRGLEIELFTRFVRIVNHSGATFGPPRSLEVVLTQPPKSSLFYNWKVIANVSAEGSWRTQEELQWPGLGKMKGIVEPLFPGPVVPETTTNWALYGVLAALGLLLIIAAIAVGIYFLSRWAKIRHCPKDEGLPFTAFFVSTHNEDEIQDLYGYKAHEVFGAVRSIVTSAASSHRCYIARRLEAHYLLVAKDPQDAVRCAAEVVTKVSQLTARAPPPAKKAIRRAGTGTPSMHGSAIYTVGTTHHTDNSGTKSERSTRSRALTVGYAASQARKTGITPKIAVGMAFAEGRIEMEDGTYTYAGEPVDIAAAIADFAIHNQILATQEVHQALPQGGALATNFEEYCEREFGRGRCAENYELHEYVADGCPRADPELAEAAREGKNESGGAVGALSAALQASNGGLVTRSVAVAAIHVPDLGSRSTDAPAIARVQGAFEMIYTVAEDFKGTFAALHDGWCYVTVNGTGGVAQAQMRATSVAMVSVDTLRDAGYTANAGVAAGPTIAGGMQCEAAAARHITAGGTTERARLLALGAEMCEAGVLVTENVKREAESSFEFAAADFITGRAPTQGPAPIQEVRTRKASQASAGMSATSMPVQLFKNQASSANNSVSQVEEIPLRSMESSARVQILAPAPPKAMGDATSRYRTMKVFSVIAASSAGDVEDEWMYQLAAAGSGPCVRINAAFDLIAEGSVAEAEVKLTEAAAAMALVDTAEMAAVDSEGQAAMKAAVQRGDELCNILRGSARNGGDHKDKLTSVSLDRTRAYYQRQA